MTETQLKTEVLRMAYAQGWAIYHVTHSPQRGRQGVGYPDLTLARDKEVLWLELKQEKAHLSVEQQFWFEALPHAYVIKPSDIENGWLQALLS